MPNRFAFLSWSAVVLLSACTEVPMGVGAPGVDAQDSVLRDAAAPLDARLQDLVSAPDMGLLPDLSPPHDLPTHDTSTYDAPSTSPDTTAFDCTTWDYSANAPCPPGIFNCDCAKGCGSTSCGGNPDAGGPTGEYEKRFHHTTTGSSDGGKSLVLCPGQKMNFDACYVGSVQIPRHGDDNGRETYWNMFQEPVGDIVCSKGGNTYKYRADKVQVNGDCS